MKLKNVFFFMLSSFLGAIAAISYMNYLESSKKASELIHENSINYQPVRYNTAPNLDFTYASSVVTPAVVHVNTSYIANNDLSQEFYGDEFFRYFFGDPKRLQPKAGEASGSGVIISTDGYILTNNHVVENAKEIKISLSNKQSYKAEIVGKDKDTDLALLKIEAHNLPYLSFANSDSVLVGQWVLAVGNPFDLASTVTAGIVSAKGRSLHLLENINNNNNTAIESFIQTDAAVNPGNSGGALVNTFGDLIGINTAIATPTGTYAGYSFAVPSNIAAKVAQDLKEFGVVQRAFLGVNIETLEGDLAKELGMEDMRGVLIQAVHEQGAAANAGLESGDLIVDIEGEKIYDVAQLQEKIAGYRPGDVIELSFLRKNNIVKATLLLKNKFNNEEVLSAED